MTDVGPESTTFEARVDLDPLHLEEIGAQIRLENGLGRETLNNLWPLLEQDGTPAMLEALTAVHDALTKDEEQTLTKLILDFMEQEEFAMAARVQFIENLTATRHTPDLDITDLQAEILSASLLPMEERFYWASTAAQLLPGDGINLDDPDAVAKAQQFYTIRQLEEQNEDEKVVLLKSLGRETIAAMYADMGVLAQGDLDSQTADLLTLVARVDRTPQLFPHFHVKQLYARAEEMGWSDPQEQVDRIITVLRRLRDILDATEQ